MTRVHHRGCTIGDEIRQVTENKAGRNAQSEHYYKIRCTGENSKLPEYNTETNRILKNASKTPETNKHIPKSKVSVADVILTDLSAVFFLVTGDKSI